MLNVAFEDFNVKRSCSFSNNEHSLLSNNLSNSSCTSTRDFLSFSILMIVLSLNSSKPGFSTLTNVFSNCSSRPSSVVAKSITVVRVIISDK
jgi:hypothetical protein